MKSLRVARMPSVSHTRSTLRPGASGGTSRNIAAALEMASSGRASTITWSATATIEANALRPVRRYPPSTRRARVSGTGPTARSRSFWLKERASRRSCGAPYLEKERLYLSRPLTKTPGGAQAALLLLLLEGGALARGLPAVPLAHGSLLSLSLGHTKALTVAGVQIRRRRFPAVPSWTPPSSGHRRSR